MDDLFAAPETDLPVKMPEGPGYKAAWNEYRNGYDVRVPNGELFYAEQFFNQRLSDRSLEYFQENDTFDWRQASWRNVGSAEFGSIAFANINWKQDSIKLYGKDIPLPRLTSWYGDVGKSYTYSGITSQPNGWNKGLLYIKEQTEAACGATFNSVLLNWYRDGNDHLNWHSDDEKELGVNPTIASVNFGAARDFLLRRKDDGSAKMTIPLRHGTLLVMRGELQHFWQHSVPKRKGVAESRFNLTFRTIG